MIPLKETLSLAFKSVIEGRKLSVIYGDKDVLLDGRLSLLEVMYIQKYLRDNCPGFPVSRDEIRLLFSSFQKKRRKVKIKKRFHQLSLFPS